MTRWSVAYRASLSDDTADSADRNPIGADTSPSPEAIEAAFDAAERAAIQAEGAGDPLAPIPHDMPTSWADPAIEPTPGGRCRCCGGSAWWREAIEPKGWRCRSCHPPVHLAPGLVRVVRT